MALIAALGAQALLGVFIHWFKRKTFRPIGSSGRDLFHFLHIGLGLAIILIGWATALTGELPCLVGRIEADLEHTGFEQEWTGDDDAGNGQFTTGWKVLFGVLMGVSIDKGGGTHQANEQRSLV